jgi:hypothetical protein
MRFVLKTLAALVLGVAIGVGSLWYAVFHMNPTTPIVVGVWRMNPLAGSAANDAYSRLYLAITSILALNRSETLYFEAKADDQGGPLTSACDYLLKGPPPDARWWSVTAYGADNMLIPSDSERYSASAASAVTNAAGEVEIALTPDGSGENGIATGQDRFELVLRLYQPSKELDAAPQAAPLFRLEKGACRA